MTPASKSAADFAQVDQSRLAFIGEARRYRVFKDVAAGGYWTTLDGEFVSHAWENPLPRD